ncbi:hypothetical protein DAEQUDRAFT_642095, partial [Daedalea quercina L-15889]
RESYSAGLLAFHVFCGAWDVAEEQRAPASCLLVLTFIAGCTGIYSGTTVRNYTASVHAWHMLHGLSWNVEEDELKALLKGADRQAPPTSK